MTRDEQARIESDGARAAAAGRDWRANPYLRRENMPAATGESLHDWSDRHDAWQRGFESWTGDRANESFG
jgi:hypothetical protein